MPPTSASRIVGRWAPVDVLGDRGRRLLGRSRLPDVAHLVLGPRPVEPNRLAAGRGGAGLGERRAQPLQQGERRGVARV